MASSARNPRRAVRDFVQSLLPSEQETAIDALIAAGDESISS